MVGFTTWKEWNDKEAYIIDYSEGDSEDDWRQDIKEIAERDGSDINLEGRDPKLIPFMNWPVGICLYPKRRRTFSWINAGGIG